MLSGIFASSWDLNSTTEAKLLNVEDVYLKLNDAVLLLTEEKRER